MFLIGRWRRAGAAGLAAVMAGTLAEAPAARAEESGDGLRVQEEPAVAGFPVPVRAGRPDRTAELAWQAPVLAWPAAGTAEVTVPAPGAEVAGSGLVPAGQLPVAVGSAPGGGGGRLRVEVFDRAAATKAGVDGLLLAVSPAGGQQRPVTVSLGVEYAPFQHAYGGSWAQRLRLVRLCDGCPPEALPSRNDPAAGRLTAAVSVAPAGTTLALVADASGPAGDYTATPFSPAGEWEVGLNTGTFQWSYPMEVPDVPGGLVPEVGLAYSSSAVDGLTVSTNAQPSVVGEGWADPGAGFVERSYRGCADHEGTPRTGDLCWVSENATLSLGGRSVELVRVGETETWRPRDDDGTRVRQRFGAGNGDVRGEWWEVTTTDGIKYHFGRQPAAESTWTVPVYGDSPGTGCGGDFAGSACDRAWRWNLDYVVDPHRNTIRYQYVRETNRYDRNLGSPPGATASYTRGGYLWRIEYGVREDGSGPAPARVEFGMADRCRSGASCALTEENYPDTPLDLRCTSTTSCGGKVSPSFWTTKRLSTVTTKMWDGTGYRDVDRWTLEHDFPEPGEPISPSLWLYRVTRTGLAGGSGAAATPPVTFPAGKRLPNRVDVVDGHPRLYKFRVDTIDTESGGQVNVVYAGSDCEAGSLPRPESNTSRCFPVTWAPAGTEPRQSFFHKYVVGEVTRDDRVGGEGVVPMVTRYRYLGGAAWRYQDSEVVPADKRTWSVFRGYQRVEVREGSGDPADGPVSATEHRYFRGMHGDRRTPSGGTKEVSIENSLGEETVDRDQYAGLLHEEVTRNGTGGPVLWGTINEPWHRGPTATQGTRRAFQVEVGTVRTRTALGGGGWRGTRVDYTYNEEGLVTRELDHADGTVDRCTRTGYARNDSTWLLDLPSEETVATTCAAAPDPEQLISRTRTYYDDRAHGAAPTAGNPTRVQEYDGGWVTVSGAAYDGHGRVTSATDARGGTTVTGYAPPAGRPTTVTETNPLGHTTTTTLDTWRGLPTLVVDANGRRTELAYDLLGRLTGVWLPGRSRSLGASYRFGYGLRNHGPSWVRTEELTATGGYRTSYRLFDGFLRERQTQQPSASSGGGRVLADTFYNSRGLVSKVNHGYHDVDAPNGELLGVHDNQIDRQTVHQYDGAGRELEAIRVQRRDERWRTRTRYGGDRVQVTPPTGGTATTTVTDARGHTVELHQHGGQGPVDQTSYAYTPAGLLETITDPAGYVWRYGYDLRGRQVSAADPDRGTATMTYDPAGVLLTRTDARGETVAHEYDALGRKVSSYAGSTGGEPLAEWTYDEAPGGLGLPSGTIRHHDGHAYRSEVVRYDQAGRPQETRVTIPAVPGEEALAGDYPTRYSYRPDGSVEELTLPAGPAGSLVEEPILYQYDDRGQPRTATGWDGSRSVYYVTETAHTEYGELGALRLGRLGSDVSLSLGYEYHSRRLSSARVLVDRGGPRPEVEHYQYGYDPAGNVTRIADVPGDGAHSIQCLDHDYLRRLVDAWTPAADDCGPDPGDATLGGSAPYWSSYVYDPVGNRTRETRHGVVAGSTDTVRSYDYPAAGQPRPHAVAEVTTTGSGGPRTDTYRYDAAGNTVTRAQQTITWDTEGRVEAVTSSEGTTSFVYDAGGDRLVRRDPVATTLYLGDQELRLDRDTGQVTGTRYYRHAGRTVAIRSGGTLTWLAGDHHSTDTTAVDASTGDVTRRRFDPFGNPRGAATPWPGERGFVGGTVDAGLGLTHLGAREYDAELGRFLSVDPILDPSDPQQMHGYAYGNNAPATFTDPSGLKACGGAAMIDGAICPPTKPKDSTPPPPRGDVDDNPYPSGNPTPRLANQFRTERLKQRWIRQDERLHRYYPPKPGPSWECTTIPTTGEQYCLGDAERERDRKRQRENRKSDLDVLIDLTPIGIYRGHREDGDMALPALLKTGVVSLYSMTTGRWVAGLCAATGVGIGAIGTCYGAGHEAGRKLGEHQVEFIEPLIDEYGGSLQDWFGTCRISPPPGKPLRQLPVVCGR